MKLTIAIPTYNRIKSLLTVLEALKCQITNDTNVLIIDNGVMSAELDTYLLGCPRFKYVRNDQNIGGDLNILRCIELSDSDYVWLLGDDDVPTSNAIETIFAYINKFSTPSFIKFSDPTRVTSSRYIDTVIKSAHQYLAEQVDLADAIFISTMIIRCDWAREELSFAYPFAYSCASQLVLILRIINSGHSGAISSKFILDATGTARDKSKNSDFIGEYERIATRLPSILNSEIDIDSKLQLSKMLSGIWFFKIYCLAVYNLCLLISSHRIDINEFRVRSQLLYLNNTAIINSANFLNFLKYLIYKIVQFITPRYIYTFIVKESAKRYENN